MRITCIAVTNVTARPNASAVSRLEDELGVAGVSFEPAQFMHFNLCWRATEYLSQANRRFIETAKVFFQEDAGSPLSR